jgi:hypothetical protein
VSGIQILEPRSTDDEASAIVDALANLQTWCVMQSRASNPRDALAAADLVQRTRCLIIERCKKPTPTTVAAERGGRDDE